MQPIDCLSRDIHRGIKAECEIGGGQIVIDRFHVTLKYRDAADDLRKQELKRLKQGLEDEAYKHLKGSMWASADGVKTGPRKTVRFCDACLPIHLP
jgi:hypothetical protein